MTTQQYAAWRDIQRMIAQYDWAVEGGTPPECSWVTDRAIATELRNQLVKLSGKVIGEEQ